MTRVIVPGVLSKEECATTVGEAERRGFEAMGPRYPADYRNNDRGVLDDAALAAKLFERLRPALPAHWEEDGARWTLQGLNPRFRFCRYREGQQFTKHRDGAWAPRADERSWLTVMLYLNDAGAFVGGQTRFYVEGRVESVAPREGQAIVFDHRLWHDGAPVSGGTKYVMRTDVIYRRDQPAEGAHPPAVSGRLAVERVLRGHAGYVWVVRKLSDGRLASGSRDCTVRAWGAGEVLRDRLAGSATALVEIEGRLWIGGRHGSIDDGRRSWPAHEGAVLGLARMANGSVISCGADGVVRRWSPTGEALEVRSRNAGWVWGVAIEGERVWAAVDPVTAIGAGCLGDRHGWLELRGGQGWQAHEGAVTAVAPFGAGQWVSAGEDCAVKVWSDGGELLGTGHHRDFVRSLAVLDQGRFASGSYDGTVIVWRCQDPGRDHDFLMRQTIDFPGYAP